MKHYEFKELTNQWGTYGIPLNVLEEMDSEGWELNLAEQDHYVFRRPSRLEDASVCNSYSCDWDNFEEMQDKPVLTELFCKDTGCKAIRGKEYRSEKSVWIDQSGDAVISNIAHVLKRLSNCDTYMTPPDIKEFVEDVVSSYSFNEIYLIYTIIYESMRIFDHEIRDLTDGHVLIDDHKVMQAVEALDKVEDILYNAVPNRLDISLSELADKVGRIMFAYWEVCGLRRHIDINR